MGKKMTLSEIQEMRKDFLDNLDDDYDARYVLTEKGQEFLQNADDRY